jgi:glycosyltransferase involved in cell wall biosynthesis
MKDFDWDVVTNHQFIIINGDNYSISLLLKNPYLWLLQKTMEKLSVVIITYNEERNIDRCLDSVIEVADEIIVVDSVSTDETEAICIRYNVTFIKQEFLGYIEQKNFALQFASNDFVLSLDADEALSPELKNSIKEIKSDYTASGYTMNRLTNYCGTWIKHCGWYPDTKLRIFNKNIGRWGGINPHDEFFFDNKEPVKQLSGDLHHYSYYSIEDHYKQVERFTDIASKAYYDRGKKSTLIKLWFSPAVKFIRDYIFLLGFLDGKAGYRICSISAKATYFKYRKLRDKTKYHTSE